MWCWNHSKEQMDVQSQESTRKGPNWTLREVSAARRNQKKNRGSEEECS